MEQEFDVVETVGTVSKTLLPEASYQDCIEFCSTSAHFWGKFFSGSTVIHIQDGFGVERPHAKTMFFEVKPSR